MTRIPVPQWARPFERSVDEAFRQARFEIVEKQHEAILKTVHEAIQSYIDDCRVTAASEDAGFPSVDRMTGEYYIGDEAYWVVDEPWFPAVGRRKEYRFSFMARCLEKAWVPDQQDRDYLGLEVHFSWDPGEERFEFQAIDSSSI